MPKKVIYRWRYKAYIRTKNGDLYKTASTWKYRYGELPKRAAKISIPTFNQCLDSIDLHCECWPDMFINQTFFTKREYISVLDPVVWETPNRIFEKDFAFAQWKEEVEEVYDISLSRIPDVLNYIDYMEFAQDNNIKVHLK